MTATVAYSDCQVMTVTTASGLGSGIRRRYPIRISGDQAAPTIQHFLITAIPENLIEEVSYKLSAPIVVTVQQTKDAAIASFDAANIHMSGDTIQEAIEHLLLLMLDLLETFSADEAHLAKEPRRQLDVLRSYIQPLNAD